MSIITYHFSERGIMHVENDMPCQDSSDVLSYGMWRVAAVADGVGSCKHSDEASKIAVKAALKTVYNCFPNNCKEEDLLSLITMAFHCAANSVEMHVNSVRGEIKDYHTTLALALYDGKNLYYGNAGDSGIIALDDYGEYHVVSKKQNNEYDEVITLASRSFEVGKVDYNVIAVFCMTDGLLDWVVPKNMENTEIPIYVPRANFFVQPGIWECKDKIADELITAWRDKILKRLKKITSDLNQASSDKKNIEEFGNLTDGNLRDDLSVAMLLNVNSDMSADQIQWTPPTEPTIEDVYCKKWREILTLHPTVAKKEFRNYIQRNNPNWSEDDVDDFAAHIWEISNKSKNASNYESAINEETALEVTENKEQPSVLEEKPIQKSAVSSNTQKGNTNDSSSKSKSKSEGLGHWVKKSLESVFSSKSDEEDENCEHKSESSGE